MSCVLPKYRPTATGAPLDPPEQVKLANPGDDGEQSG